MQFLKKYKHFWIVPVYATLYMLVFIYVENRSGLRVHMISSVLDEYIPFCEFFIIPYYLWFPYILGTVLYFGFADKNKTNYYCLIFTLGIGMTLFLIISMLFPNGHTLRPTYFARDNFFIDMVRALHKIDTSTNVFPSIHVFNSIAAALAIARSQSLRKYPRLITGSNILCVLIIGATVLLKQHSLVDVIGAIILNVLCYFLIYRPRLSFDRKTVSEVF